jgi:CRP-like cAMP-binding protein
LSQDGRELIVGLRSHGWILGVALVIAQRPNTITAVTLIQSQLRCIPAEDLLHLARTDTGFSWYLNKLLSYEIYDLLSHSVRLGSLSARQKLKELLLQLISVLELKKSQREIRLQIPLKREEIAQMIAVSPEHVSRMLKQMEQEGVIHKKKGWIIIPDVETLSAFD